jgi:hypothetical protein
MILKAATQKIAPKKSVRCFCGAMVHKCTYKLAGHYFCKGALSQAQLGLFNSAFRR